MRLEQRFRVEEEKVKKLLWIRENFSDINIRCVMDQHRFSVEIRSLTIFCIKSVTSRGTNVVSSLEACFAM